VFQAESGVQTPGCLAALEQDGLSGSTCHGECVHMQLAQGCLGRGTLNDCGRERRFKIELDHSPGFFLLFFFQQQ
jgi:hypothetical protein